MEVPLPLCPLISLSHLILTSSDIAQHLDVTEGYWTRNSSGLVLTRFCKPSSPPLPYCSQLAERVLSLLLQAQSLPTEAAAPSDPSTSGAPPHQNVLHQQLCCWPELSCWPAVILTNFSTWPFLLYRRKDTPTSALLRQCCTSLSFATLCNARPAPK